MTAHNPSASYSLTIRVEIPAARREIIEGTAHMPSMERPQEFDRLVLGFLSDGR